MTSTTLVFEKEQDIYYSKYIVETQECSTLKSFLENLQLSPDIEKLKLHFGLVDVTYWSTEISTLGPVGRIGPTVPDHIKKPYDDTEYKLVISFVMSFDKMARLRNLVVAEFAALKMTPSARGSHVYKNLEIMENYKTEKVRYVVYKNKKFDKAYEASKITELQFYKKIFNDSLYNYSDDECEDEQRYNFDDLVILEKVDYQVNPDPKKDPRFLTYMNKRTKVPSTHVTINICIYQVDLTYNMEKLKQVLKLLLE